MKQCKASKKILFAEDDAEIREMYTQAFKHRHLAIDFARDGEEALSKLSCNHYDLAVIDIMMPDLSGTDLIRQLRKNQDKVKIIILSNLTPDSVPADVCDAAAKFIVKAETTPPDLIANIDKFAAAL